MAMKSSSDMRASPSIVGLCASVLSMITAKARTYAASGVAKTPGLHRQYRAANASITRSIFCASPGRRNGPPRNARSATSNSAPTKSCASTKARVVRAASADPKNSPAATGSTPREEKSRRKDATANGSSASNTPARELARGLRLNREMAASTDAFAALAAPKRADSDARALFGVRATTPPEKRRPPKRRPPTVRRLRPLDVRGNLNRPPNRLPNRRRRMTRATFVTNARRRGRTARRRFAPAARRRSPRRWRPPTPPPFVRTGSARPRRNRS